MIALVDYGAGNLTSVQKALAAVGAEAFTPAVPADLDRASAVIVPGVGHFAGTRVLGEQWRAAIHRVIAREGALLGICLGMQWLFEGSDEAPDVPGLGVIHGRCVSLAAEHTNQKLDPTHFLKVPHVGWNSVVQSRSSRLLAGVPAEAQVYFTHSYVAPVVDETVAFTGYGAVFSAAVEAGRVAGVQFHPEKSGEVGVLILRNWVEQIRSTAEASMTRRLNTVR